MIEQRSIQELSDGGIRIKVIGATTPKAWATMQYPKVILLTGGGKLLTERMIERRREPRILNRYL